MGKKVARLEGNRDLNEKAIKSKMKSMKVYGQLVPAIVVDAEVAQEQGLKVVDFVSGEVITEANAKDYVVLLDANHRYDAHLRLVAGNEKANTEEDKYTEEFYFVYALNPSVAIDKALAEINIATTPWKGADYVKGVKMMMDAELPGPGRSKPGGLMEKGAPGLASIGEQEAPGGGGQCNTPKPF